MNPRITAQDISILCEDQKDVEHLGFVRFTIDGIIDFRLKIVYEEEKIYERIDESGELVNLVSFYLREKNYLLSNVRIFPAIIRREIIVGDLYKVVEPDE